MAVTYATAVKTARLNQVVAAIDAGSGAGYIEICSAGYADVLATIPLADPCGSVTDDVLTFDTSPAIEDSSADDTGTGEVARIKDSDGNIVISGLTVATSGANINLTSVNIVSGESVTITSATITHS